MLRFFLFLSLFTSLQAQEFSIVSYNVQNLFDDRPTSGHRDYTYLPKGHPLKKECKKERNSYYRGVCERTDWNEEKIEKRIKNLSKVLKETPQIPSLLGLVEIETAELALRVGKIFDFDGVVATEGSDERGIQSVLLYKKSIWTLKEKKEWSFPFKTRNLLEVHLIHKKSKKKITVFVNHWPSQRSPTEKRLALAQKLVERVLKNKNSIAIGDFNTLPKENPHPFHRELFEKGQMKEVTLEEGTYFYAPKMNWNHLDRIFYKGSLEGMKGGVIKPEFATGVYEYKDKAKSFWGSRVVGIPKRANFKNTKKLGYSDHFPVFAQFKFTNDK